MPTFRIINAYLRYSKTPLIKCAVLNLYFFQKKNIMGGPISEALPKKRHSQELAQSNLSMKCKDHDVNNNCTYS